jgi:5S rRNA maturation endonuclease (ribonuclease M5)
MRIFSDRNRHCVPSSSVAEAAKKREVLEELLDELITRSSEGSVIVVEGKRDVLSLRKLGVKGLIETSAQLPFMELSGKLRDMGREVIVLTDWDRRGNILESRLSADLRYLGLEVDTELRSRLASLVRKEIKDVESLHSYMRKMRAALSKDGS